MFGYFKKMTDTNKLERPKFGYHHEPKKSSLIIQPDYGALFEAMRYFQQTGLMIVTREGYIGGFIGDESTLRKIVPEKILKVAGDDLLFECCSRFISS